MQARMRSILAIFFLLSLFAVAPVQAQVTTADLVGTVTDSSGAVVVSAQVTATNEGTTQARSAQTDASGNYLISQLHQGGIRFLASWRDSRSWSKRASNSRSTSVPKSTSRLRLEK